MLGDLREEHARVMQRTGRCQGDTRWHLRQTLDIATRYGFARLLRRKPPVTLDHPCRRMIRSSAGGRAPRTCAVCLARHRPTSGPVRRRRYHTRHWLRGQ